MTIPNIPQGGAAYEARRFFHMTVGLLLGGWVVALLVPLWVLVGGMVFVAVMLSPYIIQAYKVRDRIKVECPESVGRLSHMRYVALLFSFLVTAVPLPFGAAMIVAAPFFMRQWYPSIRNTEALEPGYFRINEIIWTVVVLVIYIAFTFAFANMVPWAIQMNDGRTLMTAMMPGVTILTIAISQVFAYVFWLGHYGVRAATRHDDMDRMMRQFLADEGITPTAAAVADSKTITPRLWEAAEKVVEAQGGLPTDLAKAMYPQTYGSRSLAELSYLLGLAIMMPGTSALVPATFAERATGSKYGFTPSFNPFVRGSRRSDQ